MIAPTAVVWSAVLAVLERASRGWKVRSSAMAGGIGCRCLPDVVEVGCGSMREVISAVLARSAALHHRAPLLERSHVLQNSKTLCLTARKLKAGGIRGAYSPECQLFTREIAALFAAETRKIVSQLGSRRP
jgi:hypothetical protein